jgi:predicted kinase
MAARPLVIVVSGPPASGKSRLAGLLAARYGWPVLAKDDFKEFLFEVLGTGDAGWSARLSRLAFALQFETALDLSKAGRSFVLEGNFDAGAHAAHCAALGEAGARLVQVACRAEPAVLSARLIDRACKAQRHPGHLDGQAAAAGPRTAAYAPLPIEPTFVYDTSRDPGGLPDLGL